MRFKTSKSPAHSENFVLVLGACKVYWRFIKSFAAITRMLDCLTLKDADTDSDNMTKEQLQVFKMLKENGDVTSGIRITLSWLDVHARHRRIGVPT